MGTLRVTGHSLRPTGAQGLARLGLDVWAIQLIGRWGSAAVLGYVRESAAGPEAALARRAQLGRNLQGLGAARRQDATLERMTRLALAEVRAQIPGFLAGLRVSLLAELRQAPATSASSSASTASSSTSSPCSAAAGPAVDRRVQASEFVSSAWTSCRHKVLLGPRSLEIQDAWQTCCGWRFGGSVSLREPQAGDLNCKRCFGSAA